MDDGRGVLLGVIGGGGAGVAGASVRGINVGGGTGGIGSGGSSGGLHAIGAMKAWGVSLLPKPTT